MEPHHLATILVPGDFVVLHTDGSISGIPRGKGMFGPGGIRSCPLADAAYIPKWQLSMKYFSFTRGECLNELQQCLRHSAYTAQHTEQYLQHVSAITVAAGAIQDFAEVQAPSLCHIAFTGETQGILDWMDKYQLPRERYRDRAVEAARTELAQAFPETDFSPCLKATGQFPFVELDKDKFRDILSQKLKTRIQVLEEPANALNVVHEMREYARGHLGGLRSTGVARSHIADIQNFPRKLKEKWLRPLLYLALADQNNTVKLSMGAGTGYFNPNYCGSAGIAQWNNLGKCLELGTEAPSEHHIYSTEQLCGRPIPGALGNMCARGGATEDYQHIKMEELVHASLETLYNTHSLPYGGYSYKQEQEYKTALLEDIAGNNPRHDKNKQERNARRQQKLGLHRYRPEDIASEAIAKVLVYAEKNGLEAARQEFPNIIRYTEKYVLPDAKKRCGELAIDPERGIMTHELRVDMPEESHAMRVHGGIHFGPPPR